MDQQTLQVQLSEEMAKFQRMMAELRLLKAASFDLKKFRKMIPHKKYD